MGAWGAIIMSFFGAVFGSLTLYWQLNLTGAVVAVPFIMFALIAAAAVFVLRAPGEGLTPSKKQERVILWSTIGEGVGLFVVANLVINLDRPDLLLPSMALIVGLHFLPIAVATAFRPYYVLGVALGVTSAVGFIVGASISSAIVGALAASALWIASIIAVRRDWRAKKIASARP